MNQTTPELESSLCQDFQERVTDKTYILISISLLALIGILGVVGNTLVLLVYYQSPSQECHCCCNSLPSRCVSRFRGGLQHSQRKLLVALAIADLLTALIVLPCDIGHKVLTLLNISNFTNGLVDNARNIMFTLEGSILTSIAIDRFLVIGCPYVKTMSTKHRPCVFSTSDISSDRIASADKPSNSTSLQAAYEEDKNIPVELTSLEEIELSTNPKQRRHFAEVPVTPWNIRRQLCVFLPVTITTLIVSTLEMSVFVLHIHQHRMEDGSLPAAKLRYFLNRLYLICTIITFPVVCGLYLCIFLAVRNFDRKRARLHEGRSTHRTRSRRTALTLFITTLVFYLTLLPVLIVHFGNWSHDKGTREDIVRDVHMDSSAVYIHHEFYYINNAVNFFIYSWISPAFRRRVRELCASC